MKDFNGTPYSMYQYPLNLSSYFYLFKDAGTDTDAYTDTDDRKSPNDFQLIPFLSGYGCVDTDTDKETWHSGLNK